MPASSQLTSIVAAHCATLMRLMFFGLVTFSLLASHTPASAATPAAPESKPDIVVLMTDDLDNTTFENALDTGFLPNIATDLVAGGTSFDESFVTDSLCCPSRATFLTGQYPHNHGVLNITAPEGTFSAFDDSHSLATWLQAVGYHTGIIGKYLNGYGYMTPKNCPTCTAAQSMRWISPGWSDWEALPDYGELNGSAGVGYAGAYCMFNYSVNDNGTLVNYLGADSDYQTDVIARRAGAMVDAAAGTGAPMFLYLAPLAPHYELCLDTSDPFRVDVRPAPRHANSLPSYVNLDIGKASFNEADVSDKPAWYPTYYPGVTATQTVALNRFYRHRLEALRAIDDLYATVKQHLVSAGRWSNTVVVFTSDNGWLYGEHRAAGKVLAYEESIRVPLLIRGPGVPAGQHRSALVLNNDLAPTIAELAGAIPAPSCDGRSLLPLFAADNPLEWRRRFLIEHFHDGPGAPVWFYDYLAVRSAPGDFDETGQQILIDWRADLLHNPVQTGFENYKLDTDPYQLDSIPQGDSSSAQQQAALEADIAILRDCGKPGRLACIDAERAHEHIFYGGFE